MQIIKQSLKDKSLQALVVSNILTIAFAIIFGWNFVQILWVYWVQSVFIGVTTYFKILSSKNSVMDVGNMDGFSVNLYKNQYKQQLAKNYDTIYNGVAFVGRFFLAKFFCFHYGIFHLVYAVFLLAMKGIDLGDLESTGLLLIPIISFITAEIVNTRQKYKAEQNNEIKKQNIMNLFFLPYFRIVPMHITIILGSVVFDQASLVILIIFTALKTVADIGTHIVEQRILKNVKPIQNA